MNGLRIAFELLRTPRIGPFLIGRTVAATAVWMERIALGWLMWEATGSAAAVGALAFARLAPSLVFGPWGGVLADRCGGILVLKNCYAVAVPLALIAATLVVIGHAGPMVLLAIGAASGVLHSMANGPMKSAVSDVAPRERLATAIPFASVTFNAAAFIGPAIAGTLIATIGAALVFAAVAAGFGAFVLILNRIPGTVPEPRAPQSALRSFVEAGQSAARHPVIGPLLWLHVSFSFMMRPIIELLPAVSGRLVGGGPQSLGLLTAAMGLGAFAGSLWLTWRSGSPGLLRPILGAATLACLAALLLASGGSELQAAACFAALGGTLVVRAAGGNTLVQLIVEDHFRGRVMAVWGTVLRLGAAVGGLLLGILADIVGMQSVILVAAMLALVSIVPVASRLRGSAL